MATTADLDALALSLPHATKLTSDGRPESYVHAAVLVRIPQLERLDRDELRDLVAEAWLTRAQKRVAQDWLAGQR